MLGAKIQDTGIKIQDAGCRAQGQMSEVGCPVFAPSELGASPKGLDPTSRPVRQADGSLILDTRCWISRYRMQGVRADVVFRLAQGKRSGTMGLRLALC